MGCGSGPPGDPAEAAFSSLREQLMATEDPGIKAAAAERFLAEFPDSEHAPRVLDAAVYYLSQGLDEPARARDLAEETMAAVEDPERRFAIGVILLRTSLGLADSGDLNPLAAELASHRPFTYSELADLMEAAVNGERWALAEQYADGALELATPEAYRAAYPDRELDDTAVERRVDSRRANSLAHRGWARFNQGRHEEAMTDFEAGHGHSTTTYVGIPWTPIDTYWGLAAAELGKLERAEELLIPDAVMGGSEEAMAGLCRVYAARTGSEKGIDQYLWSRREAMARTIDDFALPTYDGSTFSMASLRNRVVLLAFWFPT
jgi:hypothetical protein